MFKEMGFRGAAYLPFRAIGLSEEDAVFFATQHRHKVPTRVCWLRLKLESILLSRPLNCRSRAEERTLEALQRVLDLRGRHDAAPFHIEGRLRTHGRHRRYSRIWETQIAR